MQSVIDRVTDELGDDGRTLVRPSGTEPVLRIMVEAKLAATCDEAVERIVASIREQGLLVE